MRLTKDLIEQLRKEFLVLMKNERTAPSMNYPTLQKWHQALRRWSAQRFTPIVEAIATLIQEWPSFKRRLMETTYPLRSLALPVFRTPDSHWSEEAIAADLQRRIPRWGSALRRQAQAAWRVMEEAMATGELEQELPVVKEENLNLEGFQVVLKYKTQKDLEELPEVREVLRQYTRAAQDRLPILLRRQLPLVLDFSCNTLSEFGAVHENTHISVCVSASLIDNTSAGVQTLAHEMGHHLYQRYLSAEDQKLWKTAISGNYGTLDLRQVLKEHSPHSVFPDPDLAQTNPILYLQLGGLRFSPLNGDLKFTSIYGIREYLEEGGDPQVKVHTKPISEYGAKNDEEAFCEAVGMLVGYGPKAVLPEVRQILRILFPTIKISKSLARIVAFGRSGCLDRE